MFGSMRKILDCGKVIRIVKELNRKGNIKLISGTSQDVDGRIFWLQKYCRIFQDRKYGRSKINAAVGWVNYSKIRKNISLKIAWDF